MRSLRDRLRRGAGELARFGAVGAVAYVIDVGTFNMLVHYGSPGLLSNKPITAKILATVLATLFAYVANREWTWRDRGRRGFAREYTLFFVLNAIALVITLVPLVLSRYVFHLDSALADNISANVIGVGLGTIFRFWSYRRWVFPRKSAEAIPQPLV
jgi:putative flippase GtrA